MSDGLYVEKSVCDRRVRKAKAQKLAEHLDMHGYIFCTNSKCKSPNTAPFDCSHVISVDECQKTGHTELAWNVFNLQILCRSCHQVDDKLNLSFN